MAKNKTRSIPKSTIGVAAVAITIIVIAIFVFRESKKKSMVGNMNSSSTNKASNNPPARRSSANNSNTPSKEEFEQQHQRKNDALERIFYRQRREPKKNWTPVVFNTTAPEYRSDTSVKGHFTELVREAVNQGVEGAIVFIGDSITWGMQNNTYTPQGNDVWQSWVQKGLPVVNMGMPGEEPQNMSYRFEFLLPDLEKLKPRAFFVMGGTNTIGLWSSREPDVVSQSIQDLVDRIESHFPASIIVVQTILPVTTPLIQPGDNYPIIVEETNKLLKEVYSIEQPKNLCSGSTFLVDVASKYLDPSGQVNASLFADGLHPAVFGGYNPWKSAIDPILDEIMRCT